MAFTKCLPHLFLGDASDARNADALRSRKIVLIVNCSPETPNHFPKEYTYLTLHVGVEDEKSKLSDEIFRTRALNVILHHVYNQKNVLVHCERGVSRAPSVVALFLHKVLGITIAEAVTTVKKYHPTAFASGEKYW